MKVTDRITANYKSDYCMEFDDGTYAWIKDNEIIEANDMFEQEHVNQIIKHILMEYEEKMDIFVDYVSSGRCSKSVDTNISDLKKSYLDNCESCMEQM